mmetsp:Transcript_71389/g.168247  ORF Transcript_71389/g.168247 Transcript_71389/m.168247 type:complete len:244 (-) Transcript_71389:968-1699(-)
MPSLKPLTAAPRSEPTLRSFLVPKMAMTTTRTISQCQMLNEPMMLTPCGLAQILGDGLRCAGPQGCSHGHHPCGTPTPGLISALQPRPRPAHHVQMQVIDLLAAVRARVDDVAEAPRDAQLLHQPRAQGGHLAQQRRLGLGHLGHRRDMALGDDEQVDRRPGMDVVEGEHILVLVGLPARDLAGNDLAENAVRVSAHHFVPRCANSVRPDRPSRRASSASTLSGFRPKWASATRLWNHRSATS